MFLVAAISLGLLGSLHCVGMCGPIALALPVGQMTPAMKFISILLYNIGRASTYALLGVLFGLAGSGFAFFGLQQILSISLGIIILIAVLLPKKVKNNFSATKFVSEKLNGLKSYFATQLRKKGPGSLFVVGLLNGLLPCGLVYMALAGAMSTGDWMSGGLFMFIFGLGTIPAMLAVSMFSSVIQVRYKTTISKVVPYMLVIMAGLMIVRGLNLGIPYVSPSMKNEEVVCCHEEEKCEKEEVQEIPECCKKNK